MFAPSGVSVQTRRTPRDPQSWAPLGEGYLVARTRQRITRDGGQSLLASQSTAEGAQPDSTPSTSTSNLDPSSSGPSSSDTDIDSATLTMLDSDIDSCMDEDEEELGEDPTRSEVETEQVSEDEQLDKDKRPDEDRQSGGDQQVNNVEQLDEAVSLELHCASAAPPIKPYEGYRVHRHCFSRQRDTPPLNQSMLDILKCVYP